MFNKRNKFKRDEEKRALRSVWLLHFTKETIINSNYWTSDFSGEDISPK